jgi:bifunctional UDP-N-acetylglucosamine pyrophosphorylase/glucosamine-1-phosphate N-acetyltransferase
MKIHSQKKVHKSFQELPQPEQWTAIIPAAGRGSRLGYDKPKILYPIAGRPILDWLIDLLEPTCQRMVFILSPHGAPEVEPFLKRRVPRRYAIVIQPEPRGMADAIYQAVPKLRTPFTLIIWGDQVAIRPKTIRSLMKIQQFIPTAMLSMPAVKREEPYVHYQTDSDKRLVRILERREGAIMPAVGESDCGLFAFNTKRLQEIFALEIHKGISYSQATKEWNFLPMLPQFETGEESVNWLRLNSLEETIGVNNKEEAAILEAYLRRQLE